MGVVLRRNYVPADHAGLLFIAAYVVGAVEREAAQWRERSRYERLAGDRDTAKPLVVES